MRAFDDVLVAKRMVREIRLLRQLNHDNVIRILDLLPPPSMEAFDDVYIVMERMDTDLHHIIYSGQALKESHIQVLLYQMLCGLRYIHSAKVIHRDLKPANILVNTNCELKLCDFGLARSLDGTRGGGGAGNGGAGNGGIANGTANGASGGPGGGGGGNGGGNSGGGRSSDAKLTEYVVTRWWRAPEVFLEANYGVGIDVWSAGCILGEMIQKKPLFMGNNTVQMLKLIMQITGKPSLSDLAFVTNPRARNYVLDMTERPPVDLAEKFPGLNPLARDLLGRMLVFDPSKRISVDDALAHPWLA
ncbi:unnamed protein product, partial [Phaeothamnion confervicola]